VSATHKLELGELGFDQGAQVVLAHAFATLEPGDEVDIDGSSSGFAIQLVAWARAKGHEVVRSAHERVTLRVGTATGARWRGAERAFGESRDGVAARAPQHWGLAARGALIEQGGPEPGFMLDSRDELWTADAPEHYRAAAAAQWDPGTAIDWSIRQEHPDAVEDALVQVLTYLIENETAALLVSARFASRTHPHYREVLQFLVLQAADEARHIEVFTRRAQCFRRELGVSTVGGRASLQTLIEEPEFSRAALLLGVLGEGTFLQLLAFLRTHAPERCTAQIMLLAAQDEARHVAFAMAHLAEHARQDKTLLQRLAVAVESRHAALQATAGLNEEVFEALILLAAGSFDPEAISRGHAAVVELLALMDAGRQSRLRRLGFDPDKASDLSALHTRNFM